MDASELLALNEWLFAQEEFDSLMPLVVKNALALCAGERGCVVLEQDGRLNLEGALAHQQGGMTRNDIEHVARFALRALEHKQAAIESDPATGLSVLYSPFTVDERQHGVIVLERARSATPFDDTTLRRASRYASQVGIAVRVTRRFEDLLERCSQLPAGQPDDPDAPHPVRPLADLEREAILHALKATGNDKRRAAQLLGISRAKVYQRLKNWGLT